MIEPFEQLLAQAIDRRTLLVHDVVIFKQVLEYDDVMNKQRTAVYGLRQQLLEGLDQKELILEDYVANLLSAVMEAHGPEAMHPPQWDVNGLKGRLAGRFGVDLEKEGIDLNTLDRHELGEAIFERLKRKYEMKEAILGGHTMRLHERMVMFSVLEIWEAHLLSMRNLKETSGCTQDIASRTHSVPTSEIASTCSKA